MHQMPPQNNKQTLGGHVRSCGFASHCNILLRTASLHLNQRRFFFSGNKDEEVINNSND